MWKNYNRPILAVSLVVLLLCSGCSSDTKDVGVTSQNNNEQKVEAISENKEENKKINNNDSTLKFSSKALSGKQISSETFKNYKLTVVNLWATYCKPCINEMPNLQKIYEEENKNGVNVLGIVKDISEDGDSKNKELAEKILEKQGVKYENIIENRSIGRYFARISTSTPVTIFIDNNGKMVGKEIEGIITTENLKKAIEERLQSIK